MIPVIICIFVAAFVVWAVVASALENRKLSVEHYQVESRRLPSEFDGFSIIFLTDLHCHSFGNQNQQLLDAVRDENPDVIMIGGDMVIGKQGVSLENTAAFVEMLALEYPVYYANGNHEQRIKNHEEEYGLLYRDYVHRLKEKGVIYLENETACIEQGDDMICVTGLELTKEQYRKFRPKHMTSRVMEECIGIAQDQYYQILLAHNPNDFEQYRSWGADLVLSGHFHGGIVQLPGLGGVISPQYQLFPKYDAGRYISGPSTMILSRGLGNHSIKLRLWNEPELSVITLKKCR